MTSSNSDKTSKKLIPARNSNQLTTLVLVLPILIIYDVGVLFTDVMNGADFFTQTLLRWTGVKGFIGIQAGLLVIWIGLAIYFRQKQVLNRRLFLPVLAESSIYALTMGTFIVFIMVDLLQLQPHLSVAQQLGNTRLFDRIILSLGAGFHEELVFRLFLQSAIIQVGDRMLNLRKWIAILFGFVGSAFLFSLAHHVGPLGEPLNLGVFVYRLIAGIFFGILYQFRSFPVAVYTHALYDIYILVLRG